MYWTTAPHTLNIIKLAYFVTHCSLSSFGIQIIDTENLTSMEVHPAIVFLQSYSILSPYGLILSLFLLAHVPYTIMYIILFHGSCLHGCLSAISNPGSALFRGQLHPVKVCLTYVSLQSRHNQA